MPAEESCGVGGVRIVPVFLQGPQSKAIHPDLPWVYTPALHWDLANWMFHFLPGSSPDKVCMHVHGNSQVERQWWQHGQRPSSRFHHYWLRCGGLHWDERWGGSAGGVAVRGTRWHPQCKQSTLGWGAEMSTLRFCHRNAVSVSTDKQFSPCQPGLANMANVLSELRSCLASWIFPRK